MPVECYVVSGRVVAMTTLLVDEADLDHRFEYPQEVSEQDLSSDFVLK